MKSNLIIVAVLSLAFSGGAMAQTVGSNALGQSKSDAGAMAATGAITFEAAEQRGSVSTTPSVYNAPSMFGYSQNNCGKSDTMAVSVTGFGFGGSVAGESNPCNTRQDVATGWNLGQHDVAKMRFNCFGEGVNRMAFEATGGVCPSSATAKGIEGAPVSAKFAVAPSVAQTFHGRINADGSVTAQ